MGILIPKITTCLKLVCFYFKCFLRVAILFHILFLHRSLIPAIDIPAIDCSAIRQFLRFVNFAIHFSAASKIFVTDSYRFFLLFKTANCLVGWI